jgi:hypothetical protein
MLYDTRSWAPGHPPGPASKGPWAVLPVNVGQAAGILYFRAGRTRVRRRLKWKGDLCSRL